MKHLYLLFALASMTFAQGLDLKKNQELQKLNYDIRTLLQKREDLVGGWVKECESVGKQLTQFEPTLLGCGPKIQVPTPPPAASVPAQAPRGPRRPEAPAPAPAQ